MRAFVAFALGAALVFVFDSAPIRLAGVIVMLAGIGLAVFVIASDEFLAGDRDSDQA